jgi:hypothetical protein
MYRTRELAELRDRIRKMKKEAEAPNSRLEKFSENEARI